MGDLDPWDLPGPEPGGGPGLEAVVPIVRADHSEEIRDRAAGGVDESDPSAPVFDVLAGALIVLYAFDDGERFRTVAQRDLTRLGVDPAAVATAAQDNLIDRLEALEVLERPDGCGMLRLDGNLEASLLVVSGLWDNIAEILGDEVVVTVPTPELVLFCGAGNHTVRRALRTARDRALAVFDDRLTDELFRFSGGAWHVEPG